LAATRFSGSVVMPRPSGVIVPQSFALLITGAAVGCATIAGIESPKDRASDGGADVGVIGDGGNVPPDTSPDGGGDVVSGCNAQSCPNGCCNGNACTAYSLQAAAGGGGVQCGTCTGGCCAHVNANTTDSGLGQAFFDCQPLCDSVDDGGSGTSCTQQGARDACNAYLASFDGGTCVQECCNSCKSGNQFLYVTPACIPGLTNGCITWAYYAPGADRAGQVWQNPPGQAYWCLTSNSGVYWR
jgi:hypothetical protein